ncbi:MAG: hypothetical protein VYC68_01950, partial [Candidatus Thermoplasmatota archaeon]|nr:hypothetical protein [Candidatus Thermoplasmatota archaeon]
MASDRITFRFPIDKEFRADWDEFLRRTRDADSTPSQTLQQLVIEYLNQQNPEEEMDDDEMDRQMVEEYLNQQEHDEEVNEDEIDEQAPPANEKRKKRKK